MGTFFPEIYMVFRVTVQKISFDTQIPTSNPNFGRLPRHIRIFNEVNIAHFRDALSTTDWSSVTASSDTDTAYTTFINCFQSIV